MKKLIFPLVAIIYSSSAIGQEGSIGYGSSTAIITEKIQEGFLSGFEVGFQTIYSQTEEAKLVKFEQVNDGSALGAQTSVKKLLSKEVAAFVGFPGSSDALLVAPFARDNQMIAIFPGCNHPGLSTFGPTVFTTGHSGNFEVVSGLDFGFSELKLKKGLVVINPMAAPSLGLEKEFLAEETKKRFLGRSYDIVRLDSNLLIPEPTLQKLKTGGYDFLFLTPYPEASRKFTEQLSIAKISLPIIAGSAWGTVDSDIARRFVAERKGAFYMMTSWDSQSKYGKEFRKQFLKHFAKEPTGESAYGYDLGVISAQILKRINGPITKKSFRESFESNRCFDQLSIGKLCFPKNGGHASRPIVYLKFTKDGYKKVGERNP